MLCASTISALCYWRGAAIAELHVICALRDKRSELAGMMNRLEQQLTQHRASLAHLDATMQLFDPDIRPDQIRPRQQRPRNAWFRPGECLRLIRAALPLNGGSRKTPRSITEHLCIAAECDSRRRLMGMLSSHIG